MSYHAMQKFAHISFFLPTVVLSQNSSVVGTLAFGPGRTGFDSPNGRFIFGMLFFLYIFFNDGKVIDTQPLRHINTDC